MACAAWVVGALTPYEDTYRFWLAGFIVVACMTKMLLAEHKEQRAREAAFEMLVKQRARLQADLEAAMHQAQQKDDKNA